MEHVPPDVINEILKYVKTRQLGHIAQLNKRLQNLCKMHFESSRTTQKSIKIGNGSRHIKVFYDDDLSDLYKFFCKRTFTSITFIKDHIIVFESSNADKYLDYKKVSETQLQFPLFTCTCIAFANSVVPQKETAKTNHRQCTTCCIVKPKMRMLECSDCGDYFCFTCNQTEECSDCHVTICIFCETNCRYCGNGSYCSNCLYNSLDRCWKCRS